MPSMVAAPLMAGDQPRRLPGQQGDAAPKLFGTAKAPAPSPLATAKKIGKTPTTVADSPEVEESLDAMAARLNMGGGLAAALALTGVWWGL